MSKFRVAVTQLLQTDQHQILLVLFEIKSRLEPPQWDSFCHRLFDFVPKADKDRLISTIQVTNATWLDVDRVLADPLDEAVTITFAALNRRSTEAQRLFLDALTIRARQDIKAEAVVARLIALLGS